MKHLDVEELHERLGGDDDIVQEALQIFYDSVQRRLSDLHEALGAGERERLRKLGHTVKGAALTVSAPELARLASLLEERAEAGTDGDLRSAVEDVCAEYTLVSGLIREHTS